MANGHGGARRGAGRKPAKGGFRKWCRQQFNATRTEGEVLAYIERIDTPWPKKILLRRMIQDPEFALKMFEHGFGKPPQALDLRLDADERTQRRYVVELGDGTPVSPAVAGLPAAGDAIDIPGRSDDQRPPSREIHGGS